MINTLIFCKRPDGLCKFSEDNEECSKSQWHATTILLSLPHSLVLSSSRSRSHSLSHSVIISFSRLQCNQKQNKEDNTVEMKKPTHCSFTAFSRHQSIRFLSDLCKLKPKREIHFTTTRNSLFCFCGTNTHTHQLRRGYNRFRGENSGNFFGIFEKN